MLTVATQQINAKTIILTKIRIIATTTAIRIATRMIDATTMKKIAYIATNHVEMIIAMIAETITTTGIVITMIDATTIDTPIEVTTAMTDEATIAILIETITMIDDHTKDEERRPTSKS